MQKKIKKVALQSKEPISKRHRFKVIDKGSKAPTIIMAGSGIVGAILLIPLIASAVWLINLLATYFTPALPGVQQAPVSMNKIFALTAFMVGYSIFLGLFYISKRKKSK